MRNTTPYVWSVAAAAAVLAAPALADDLNVPRAYGSIDAALAAAQPGDRVLVTGGRHRDFTVAKDGVTLQGTRGATLVGDVFVSGDDVTLKGFRIADHTSVVIEGTSVRFLGNVNAGRTGSSVRVDGGSDVLIEGNSWWTGGVAVETGTGVVIRRNRTRNGKIRTRSAGTLIEDNSVQLIDVGADLAEVVNNRSRWIEVKGDDAVIELNRVSSLVSVSGDRASILENTVTNMGISVVGDDARIERNTLERGVLGVSVLGNGAIVSDNDVRVQVADRARRRSFFRDEDPVKGDPGISIRATLSGTIVERNRVTHTAAEGIVLVANGASVRDNVVVGQAGATSIEIFGFGNSIERNDVSRAAGAAAGSGSGISVSGDDNLVSRNSVANAPLDAIVVVFGDRNTLSRNSVAIAKRCGVLLANSAVGTDVTDCEVSGAGIAFVNAGTDTRLSSSTAERSRIVDVLEIDPFLTFEGNVFETRSSDVSLLPPLPLARPGS